MIFFCLVSNYPVNCINTNHDDTLIAAGLKDNIGVIFNYNFQNKFDYVLAGHSDFIVINYLMFFCFVFLLFIC